MNDHLDPNAINNRSNNEEEEEDIDIYADLCDPIDCIAKQSNPSNIESISDPSIDEIQVYGKLISYEKEIKNLQNENSSLREENENLKSNLSKANHQIKVLKTNISALYKTAKLELDRRQQEKQNLQNKYDDLIFKRIKSATNNLLVD